jgi:hypothetical protein
MKALERVVRGAYDVGALGATDADAAFYRALGWDALRGPTSALTPMGVVRTADDDGSIYVHRVAASIDLGADSSATGGTAMSGSAATCRERSVDPVGQAKAPENVGSEPLSGGPARVRRDE